MARAAWPSPCASLLLHLTTFDWQKSVTLTSDEPYQAVVFPDGFSAHWIRARVAVPTGNEHTFQATVYFHYT